MFRINGTTITRVRTHIHHPHISHPASVTPPTPHNRRHVSHPWPAVRPHHHVPREIRQFEQHKIRQIFVVQQKGSCPRDGADRVPEHQGAGADAGQRERQRQPREDTGK